MPGQPAGPAGGGQFRIGFQAGSRQQQCPWRHEFGTDLPGGSPCAAAVALTVSAAAIAAIGLRPATPALITGAITWLILTGRRDLAPVPQPTARASGGQRPRPRRDWKKRKEP
jgi:hypothetical protein